MSAPFNNNNNNNNQKINNLKRHLTLDLNQAKKNQSLQITSPDLKLLDDVNTPELERIILADPISTNTPTVTPSILFPKTVTKEQESFATGFIDVLNSLHSNSQASDSSSTVYTDLEQPNLTTFLPHAVKEEPQTVPNIPNSPPLSPVNMEYQERMKLERKRQRNRLAASKCRSRKLERISKLEDKVKLLKGENNDLGSMVNLLKERVGVLKVEVMEHVHAGCNIMVNTM